MRDKLLTALAIAFMAGCYALVIYLLLSTTHVCQGIGMCP